MYSYLKSWSLFPSIIIIVLCVAYSLEDNEEFDDWFKKQFKATDIRLRSEDQYSDNSSSADSLVPQISAIFYEITDTLTEEISTSTSNPITTTTSTTTPLPNTPSPTTSSPTTPSPATTRSTTTPIPITSTVVVSQTTSTDYPINTISTKPLGECMKIALNAKIFFKYNSTDGIDQQIQLNAGNTNGELVQPNKCDRNQKLIIKYELIESTQIILGFIINDSHVMIESIRFEYPIQRLPEDYKRPDDGIPFPLCSADYFNQRSDTTGKKCLTADYNHLTDYSMKYRINEQIYCKELPLIKLKTNNIYESIEILIIDLRLVITNSDIQLTEGNTNQLCPIVSNNSTVAEDQTMFAGSRKIWIGISYALVGALVMFGFILLYEKIIRKRFLYSSVRRDETQI